MYESYRVPGAKLKVLILASYPNQPVIKGPERLRAGNRPQFAHGRSTGASRSMLAVWLL